MSAACAWIRKLPSQRCCSMMLVFCAPTAFGKTVAAAAMIARRGVNTLVLVHRTELLKQWQERLQAFLGIDRNAVGTVGGGKARPTERIEIAVMQSLSRQGAVNPLVDNYGQVIVDECHHVGAVWTDPIHGGEVGWGTAELGRATPDAFRTDRLAAGSGHSGSVPIPCQ